jgi:hypothetical protein
MYVKLISGIVQWLKKGKALNMIPVRMSYEKVTAQRSIFGNGITQILYACAAVKYEKIFMPGYGYLNT